jgi:excisionase family DNA binding protein
MASDSTTPNAVPTSYTIKAAAASLGLSEVYVRRMIQKGKLETVKARVGDTEVWRHEIPAEVLAEWRNSAGQRSTRDDGRNKYTLYATAEELATIQALFKTNKVEAPIGRSNTPEATKKHYLAQKAKKMAKKAAAIKA